MQTELVHQNAEATIPLRISLEVVCNTPDEQIIANIRKNSAGRTGWVKRVPAHDGIAVICGSGPSLRDDLQEVESWHKLGATVFALNGACLFLNRRFAPDYQVILDAQPQTVGLIGQAENHLFASQVDPECFARVPDAILWQATHGELALEFPEYQDDYCMIGGAISVGNAAMVLAYVLGYRTLHLYGYDSSHSPDGDGHAMRQKLNDGDPTTIVEYGGRQYVSSLTMNLQAKHFIPRAKALEAEGTKIFVHGYGLLPAMWNEPLTEQDKYRLMWAQPQYREVSCGEQVAPVFVDLAHLGLEHTVLDVGCGTGRGGKAIKRLSGCQVHYVDFADNCGDEPLAPFTLCDLRAQELPRADFVFCSDVMEHIPPEDVDGVLGRLFRAAPHVFLQISLVDDQMGALIGQKLHLSVHSAMWWLDKLRGLGRVLFFRDLGTAAIFYMGQHNGSSK